MESTVHLETLVTGIARREEAVFSLDSCKQTTLLEKPHRQNDLEQLLDHAVSTTHNRIERGRASQFSEESVATVQAKIIGDGLLDNTVLTRSLRRN